MADARDSKRLRIDEDVGLISLITPAEEKPAMAVTHNLGTISLITPVEEKPEAVAVEFVENIASRPLTPDTDVDMPHATHAEDGLPEGIQETEDELREHWFVGSIDQGTTSTRFLIFNGEGEPVASHQIEFENHYPESG